ncbi:MAG TPA: hypothetical protein VF434_00915 [Promineifilum sp.]
MTSRIEKLREMMGQSRPSPGDSVFVPLDDESVARLMRFLCEMRDDELTCEEVYERLDEYVDCLMARKEIGAIRPMLEHHLGICPDCRDELTALEHALRSVAARNSPDNA